MTEGLRPHVVNSRLKESRAPVAQLITVGDELLAGDIVDGNKATMAARARSEGFEVVRAVSVRDRLDEIAQALQDAAIQADVCLVSGGLGPTTDDLTIAAVAHAAGVSLVRDAEAEARLEDKFRRFGRPMAAANRKQADFPQGASILPNPIGSAEGTHLQMPGPRQCQVFVMPGVPRELAKMLDEQIVPRLRERFAAVPVPRRIYRVLGHGESSVAQRIDQVLRRARARSPGLAAMYVHYRASMPQVTVLLEATPGPDESQATVQATVQATARATMAELATLDAEMIEALSPGLYGIGSAELPARLVAAMSGAGLTLACAESCTGGGLGAMVTGVPGSSACFRGGIISYDNEIKQRLLGVPAEMLAEHGAVSEPVARAMALGARDRVGSDLGVGITGIAGPSGATPGKPVGTVHIAVADGPADDPEISHRALRLRGNRTTIQRAAAQWALKLVWDRLVDRGVASIAELDG